MTIRSAAVIVAAGSGRRLGASVPKAFVSLNGRPMLEYSLTAFQACPRVDCIVLVVPPGHRFNGLPYFDRFPKLTAIVTGGRERPDSVRAGLAAVPPGNKIILIHDAARPLIAVEQISSVAAAARRYGAAILAAPVTDTIKRARRQSITGTIDRSGLWKAQTPQGFKSDIIGRTHFGDKVFYVTDDSQLAERLNIRVRLVPGDDRNIKITSPVDMEMASCLLKKKT